MEERLDRVVSLPRESGSAEERGPIWQRLLA